MKPFALSKDSSQSATRLRLLEQIRSEKMTAKRILLWGSVAAALWGAILFRGDIRRYTKMKMM